MAPLMFRKARQSCKKMRAYAPSCRPQAIHSTLLKMNNQNPQFRLNFLCDATIHAATTVTAIAGH